MEIKARPCLRSAYCPTFLLECVWSDDASVSTKATIKVSFLGIFVGFAGFSRTVQTFLFGQVEYCFGKLKKLLFFFST